MYQLVVRCLANELWALLTERVVDACVWQEDRILLSVWAQLCLAQIYRFR